MRNKLRNKVEYTFYYYTSKGVESFKTVYRTKEQAIKFAKKAMRKDDWAVVVENQDGEVVFYYERK